MIAQKGDWLREALDFRLAMTRFSAVFGKRNDEVHLQTKSDLRSESNLGSWAVEGLDRSHGIKQHDFKLRRW
jgi:hypothetical protein